ncbi:MAG: flagellar motor protein MotB [bacterium]
MRPDQEPIIKKVKKIHRGGHHGGAWKVAYADFVTAMMALFMVLWLIAMLSAETRSAIAEYFRSFSLFKGEDSIGGETLSHMPGEIILLQQDAGGVQDGESWKRRLEERIKSELEKSLKEALDQVFLTVISGGVRIEIVERSGKAMFETGDARLLPHGQKILSIIAAEIGQLPYPIWIEGHTDAHPYREGAYTNWELSVDRANAVRKALTEESVSGDRITKVIGYAATDPIVKEDPFSPLNRRVSIVIKEQEDQPRLAEDRTSAPAAAGTLSPLGKMPVFRGIVRPLPAAELPPRKAGGEPAGMEKGEGLKGD